RAREAVAPAYVRLGDRLWLAPSCSLLHVPVTLDSETQLDQELKGWLSFAQQKLDELRLLAVSLNGTQTPEDRAALGAQRAALAARRISPRRHQAAVGKRIEQVQDLSRSRTAFAQRIQSQQARLDLPAYPTTTIGSFPQTTEIRSLRRDWRAGALSDAAYE